MNLFSNSLHLGVVRVYTDHPTSRTGSPTHFLRLLHLVATVGREIIIVKEINNVNLNWKKFLLHSIWKYYGPNLIRHFCLLNILFSSCLSIYIIQHNLVYMNFYYLFFFSVTETQSQNLKYVLKAASLLIAV